jgi:hypothetical protein
MNTVGVHVMTLLSDLPGERLWNVVTLADPLRPFAEHVIRGYLELVLPSHRTG